VSRRSPRLRRRHVVLAALLAVAALVIANAERRVLVGEIEKSEDGAFYAVPTPLPAGDPGEIIRREPILSAPMGTTAWRVVYHSRDLHGRDVAVSGVVLEPDWPAPPGGRTVVSWAHPTTGAAAHCAPSLGLDPFLDIEGMHALLAAGYAIAATDYPGLGVPGESSYLLATSEARSVLDAARAAREILGADASNRVLLWGHSQGGQAALVAAEQARTYAPELEIAGVAVAAPAAELGVLMSDNIDTMAGVTIAAYAVSAYQAAYAQDYPSGELGTILTPAGAAATPELAALCLLSQSDQLHAIAQPLIGGYVTTDPASTEPWRTLLRDNSAGRSPITVPVFVGQGLADTLVRPAATESYVARLCAQGTDVTLHTYPDIDHAFAAYASVPDLLLWLADIDGGRRAPTTCP
jgi:pimeloyl-ACP methyl ester carboxylesterase